MYNSTSVDTFVVPGFWLAFTVLMIIIAMVVCQKWIKKVTNSYFLWLVIGVFGLVWFVVFKYAPQVNEYIQKAKELDGTYQGDAYIISSAFLLDACPFSTLALSIFIIADPSRKLARSFAPIAILGGIITVFFQTPFDTNVNAEYTLRFIFLGHNNDLYFFFHAFNLLAGIGIMLNTPKYGWKGYVLTVIMYGMYYGYVAIMAKVLNCQWNVSGLNINEWTESGEYCAVAQMLHCSPKVAMCVGLPFLPLAASGIIALNDYVFKRRWWLYGNAFSGKWYNWYDYKRYKVQRFI